MNESILLNNASALDSVFHKIDLYNRRMTLCPVTEGYSRDSYDIMLDLNEQAAVSVMFSVLESEILNEFSFKDKWNSVKSSVSAKYTALKKFFTELKDKTITKVSELVRKFIELMSRLGDRISEIFGRFGLGDDTYALLEGYVKSKLSDRSLADVNLFESVASLNGWRTLNESEISEGDLDRKER